MIILDENMTLDDFEGMLDFADKIAEEELRNVDSSIREVVHFVKSSDDNFWQAFKSTVKYEIDGCDLKVADFKAKEFLVDNEHVNSLDKLIKFVQSEESKFTDGMAKHVRDYIGFQSGSKDYLGGR